MCIPMLSVAALAVLVGPAAAGADTIPPRSVIEFRGTHATLLASFDALHFKATQPAATRADRANLILFLRAEVLPHAAAEEAVLYPALEEALGTKGHATAAMVMDHRNITRLLDEMAGLTGAADPAAYNRRACQLEANLRAHFAKEQEFVLPALQQRLSGVELDAVLEQMRVLEHH